VSDHLGAEFARRSWSSAVTVVAVAAVAFPAWSLLDVVLEPALGRQFAVVRLLTEVPILLCLWLLSRRPVGRRHPAALAFTALALVQGCTAGMLAQVENVEFYLLGFSLALHGSGVLLVVRPRWTVALVAVSTLALAVNILAAAEPMGGRMLTAVAVFFSTTASMALLAHSRRWQLALREVRARMLLEDEQRRTQELLVRLDRLSHEDSLTGLANRRRWDATLAQTCTGVRDDGGSLAVVLIDLDRFKSVNDEFGHAAGDAALQAVAGLLRERLRGGDLAARLGGDELAVLLPGADLAAAVGLAERVRAESLTLLPAGYGRPGVSLSLGVAVAEGAQAQPMQLLAAADAQLYRAKTSRNAVRSAAPSLS
jgi:diguanylate cyclase (GGDEF)-like protein